MGLTSLSQVGSQGGNYRIRNQEGDRNQEGGGAQVTRSRRIIVILYLVHPMVQIKRNRYSIPSSSNGLN
jgi:hypothetical protein